MPIAASSRPDDADAARDGRADAQLRLDRAVLLTLERLRVEHWQIRIQRVDDGANIGGEGTAVSGSRQERQRRLRALLQRHVEVQWRRTIRAASANVSHDADNRHRSRVV